MGFKMKEVINSKRRGKLKAGVLFLQDNLPVHIVQIDETANSGFKLLPHPTYAPDLTSSDYCPFRKFKSYLRSRHFGNNNELISDVEEFWWTKSLPFSVMGLRRISGPSALISRGTLLKNIEKTLLFFKIVLDEA